MEQRLRTDLKVCLALLCGLPGAGKTSLAVALRLKKMERHHVLNSSPAVDVGHDAVHQCPTEAVLHLCYDDVIPRQLDSESEGGQSSCLDETADQSLSSVSLWKAHRQEIIRCVDCILARLKTGKVLDITAALDEQELSQFRREVWSKVLTSMQDQIISLKQPQPTSWAGGKQVQPALSVVLLIDDNMYYRSMRYEYYQLARKYNTGFCQVYLQCNTEVALARNSQRRNVIPEETVRKMANRMEVPDRQVTSWEKHTLCIEAKGLENEATLSTVWALIAEALLDPVLPMEVENAEEREASRAVCAASAIHQADQSLRRCVAEAVTAAKEGGSLSKAELRNLGSKLNDVRQTVLQKIRTREIWPPPLVAAAIDHPDNAERCSDFDAFIRDLFLKEQQAS